MYIFVINLTKLKNYNLLTNYWNIIVKTLIFTTLEN